MAEACISLSGKKECPRDVQSRYGADIGVVSGVEEQRRTTVKILQPVFKHAEYPLVRRASNRDAEADIEISGNLSENPWRNMVCLAASPI